jgi:hypothetical protein
MSPSEPPFLIFYFENVPSPNSSLCIPSAYNLIPNAQGVTLWNPATYQWRTEEWEEFGMATFSTYSQLSVWLETFYETHLRDWWGKCKLETIVR